MAVARRGKPCASPKSLRKLVDVVVEYSIMPQEYLVPVWNMSNKVQAEVGSQQVVCRGLQRWRIQ